MVGNRGDERLERLIERARKVEMTPEDQAAQRRSFAYGNSAFENPRITREMIAEEESKLDLAK